MNHPMHDFHLKSLGMAAFHLTIYGVGEGARMVAKAILMAKREKRLNEPRSLLAIMGALEKLGAADMSTDQYFAANSEPNIDEKKLLDRAYFEAKHALKYLQPSGAVAAKPAE